jgi:heme oxygenase
MSEHGLMFELRAATRDAHQQLESLPFARSLADGDLPVESYVGYLRAMGVIHGVLEHELPVEADARIAGVWDNTMRKLPALQRDISYFTLRAVRDIPAAHAAAETVANRLLHRSVENPLSMLGYVYVLEGATLGAAVLAPWARQTFALTDGAGLAYLESYGEFMRANWQGFGERMDRLALEKIDRAAIVAAAVEAFAGIQDVIGALYPFDPDALLLKVTAINPEAGTHPVPQDPRELEAARRAGERCLREYPYFVWRYGERGHRFTDSDGAWLVTLIKYPMDRIERQVAWLGEVLATRGMPRILLQRHLELLYEELILRVPEKLGDYAKLLAAADWLASQRRARIPDDTLDAVVWHFESAAGPDWRVRLRGTGAMLVCAVADERAGLAGTLTSVREWLTDPKRFPPRWIDAVERCIAEAEAALSPPTIHAPIQM